MTCACGARYDGDGWAALRSCGPPMWVPAGDDPAEEPEFWLEFRDCRCGSTISREIPPPTPGACKEDRDAR